jgi:hypothetical protein
MKSGYLLSFLIFLVACNGGGGGGSSSQVSLISHQGIWSNCEDYDGNSDSVDDSSILSVLAIGEDSAALTQTNYTDVGCNAGDEDYRYSNTASYTRSGNVYTTILKSDTYVSLSAADVTYSNNNSWCGISNWVINVPRSTMGLDCDGEIANEGDIDTYAISGGGSQITIDSTTYDLAIGTDFTPAGLTLPNGTFGYSDGVSFAALSVINGGNYTLYRYDLASKTYNVESGTYTSSNNVAQFNVTSSTPVGCYSGSADRRFTSGLLGVTMEFEESDLVIFAQKVSYSESNFRSAFLGGGFSLGCF